MTNNAEKSREVDADIVVNYGAPFVKILYLTDLAQKVLSLRIYRYLCTDLTSLHAEIAISARDNISACRDSYLCQR